MSLTASSLFGPTTPRQPSHQWNPIPSEEEDIQSTPVSLAVTPPALQEAFVRFSEAFDPDQEFVTVSMIGTDLRPLLSRVMVAGHFLAFRLNEKQRTDPLTADPLAVFEHIQTELMVTQKDLLIATGIKRRTFYSWKKPTTPKPRPGSLGRLWHLAGTLDDLREFLHRPIASWLHAADERLAALKDGRFDDLVELALNRTAQSGKTHGTSMSLGVAPEIDLPIVRSGDPSITVVERGMNP